jgi:uncharacterized protein (TIGR03083 family)
MEDPPVDTWRLLAAERRSLADELESIPPDAWATPSQCAGWTVRDVVAHVAMTPNLRITAVLPTMIRHRFDIPRVICVLALNDKRSPEQLVEALRDVAEARGTPPKATGENVLADIVLHGQDIRRPLGLPCRSSVDALRSAARTLANSDFNCGSARRAAGLRLIATDVDWSAGAGDEVRGPLHAILEGISGRRAALDDLSGPGVSVLAAGCPVMSAAASVA